MLWIASCEELRMALMNLNKDIGSKMVKLIKCWYKDVGICCWGEYGSCFLIAQWLQIRLPRRAEITVPRLSNSFDTMWRDAVIRHTAQLLYVHEALAGGSVQSSLCVSSSEPSQFSSGLSITKRAGFVHIVRDLQWRFVGNNGYKGVMYVLRLAGVACNNVKDTGGLAYSLLISILIN